MVTFIHHFKALLRPSYMFDSVLSAINLYTIKLRKRDDPQSTNHQTIFYELGKQFCPVYPVPSVEGTTVGKKRDRKKRRKKVCLCVVLTWPVGGDVTMEWMNLSEKARLARSLVCCPGFSFFLSRHKRLQERDFRATTELAGQTWTEARC